MAARLPDARFVDLFAGSGALGFESLSRGAREVVFVERDAQVANCLEAALGLMTVSRPDCCCCMGCCKRVCFYRDLKRITVTVERKLQ